MAAFRGVTSLELPTDGAASRTGFCAARSSPWPDHELVDCDDYGALELCLRTDGRTYGINLDVDSFTGELFQGFLTLPASPEWRTVILPFEKFVLTRGGRFTERQRYLIDDKCAPSDSASPTESTARFARAAPRTAVARLGVP